MATLICWFIRRYPVLQEVAVSEYGSVRKMAKKFGPYVQFRATQERSQFVSRVKDIFYQNKSSFALVKNVLLTDLNKEKGEFEVCQALVDSGVTSVDALRKLIRSKKMYCNPVLYNLFCSGIESGRIKYNPKKGNCIFNCIFNCFFKGLRPSVSC